MLKLKDPKKEFSIVYDSENMSENKVYDYLFTEREADMLMDNADIFILDSTDDMEDWMEMTGIYWESDFEDLAEDYSMLEYFETDGNVVD